LLYFNSAGIVLIAISSKLTNPFHFQPPLSLRERDRVRVIYSRCSLPSL
jgi:hypothetical protein